MKEKAPSRSFKADRHGVHGTWLVEMTTALLEKKCLKG